MIRLAVRSPLVAFLALVLVSAGCASRPGAGPTSGPALLPDPGPARDRELSPRFDDLARDAGAHGELRVLLELREQLDLDVLMNSQRERQLGRRAAGEETRRLMVELAERTQAPVIAALEELIAEGIVYFYMPIRFRNKIFVSCSPDDYEALAGIPAVAEVVPEFDGVREAEREAGRRSIGKAPPIPPGDSWAIDVLGLRPLWEEGIDGRGTRVGVLDSGVMGGHLSLRENRGEPFWYDPVGGRAETLDTVPHGSLVLACAVGGDVEGRAIGAAPGARWAAALSNYFNSYNNINMSLAADWLIFEAGVDVVLGAWGHGKASCDDRDLPMVSALRAAGIVPVFAAGNDGPEPGTGQTPAALCGLFPDGLGPLAVAAIDRNREVVDASSRGPRGCGSDVPYPDVAAPGWQLPVPTGPMDNSLTLASGTSFSVGWVGGVLAMMLQVAPDLPVYEAERIIRETAVDVPPAGHDIHSGYGILDAAAAVEAARAWRQ